jgi:hypothetical protein
MGVHVERTKQKGRDGSRPLTFDFSTLFDNWVEQPRPSEISNLKFQIAELCAPGLPSRSSTPEPVLS